MYPFGVEAVGEALFPIVINEWLPIEHKIASLTARLRGIDKYLNNSIKCVDEPYSLWVNYSLMVAEGISALLSTIETLGKEWGSEELVSAVGRARDMLGRAVNDIKDLAGKSREGFKPIGKELFSELLKLQFFAEPPEELRSIGYSEARRYRELMEVEARRMGCSSIEDALKELSKASVSSVDEFKEKYKSILMHVKEFVIKRDLVELPKG